MAEFTITYHDGAHRRTVPVADGEYVLEALLKAGIDHPYSCRQGFCTSCKVRLLSGTIEQDPEADCELTAAQLAAGERLICVGLARSNVEIVP
jgi:ferredoxin